MTPQDGAVSRPWTIRRPLPPSFAKSLLGLSGGPEHSSVLGGQGLPYRQRLRRRSSRSLAGQLAEHLAVLAVPADIGEVIVSPGWWAVMAEPVDPIYGRVA